MRSLSQCLPRQADPRGDFPEQAQGNGVALARAFWQAIASCSISAVSLSWDSSPSPQTMPRSRARFHRIRSALVVAMNLPSHAVTVTKHKTASDLPSIQAKHIHPRQQPRQGPKFALQRTQWV